ncbi:Uncharacterised protein [Kluyvera cryocrescens]|uniref:Uncharacterized protein n=1 Tax=Kluyvera cryocrescens TaxID=580 RepID=A0A485AT79_KLUCR|nr:Uncharacterised protein [Kluyvera cryocrescens]
MRLLVDADDHRKPDRHQRMSDVSHVHADLVRTSGFQTQPQTRVHTEVFHDAIVRDRRFTHWVHRHMRTLGWMTADRFLNGTARSHMTNRHGLILTGNFTQLQRFHQTRLRRDGFRHDHQPGGVFIQTMHNTGARYVSNRG